MADKINSYSTTSVHSILMGLSVHCSQSEFIESIFKLLLRSGSFLVVSVMIRRNNRLRKEYLYRKSLENQEKATYERKQKLKEAVQAKKPIPNDLRKDAKDLEQEMFLDEAQKVPTTHIDDEYQMAGVTDPKILITTSRDPSSRLAQFAKEMRLVFPNSQRINRGHHVLSEIVDACRSNGVTDLIFLHETRGQPDGFVVSHFPHGPTAFFTLHNVVLRHDIEDRGTVSEVYPHLILNNFSSSLGQRIMSILKHLFPVPKEDSKRVLTFANDQDYISFRHHVFAKINKHEVQLAEVGPRFEMKPYQIKLGTIELTDADTEWVHRPYFRTAKKRDVL